MQALISLLWDIVLIRRGPRDLPSSWALLALLGALYLATSVLGAELAYGAGHAFVRGGLDLVLTVAVFWAALAFRDREHRLMQTLSALFGVGILLAVPDFALLLLIQGASKPAALLLQLLALALLLWNVVVVGHIVRAALDVKLFTGITVAMSYIVGSTLLFSYLPAPAPAG